MLETTLAVICAALAVALIFRHQAHKTTKTYLGEFKSLFELSSHSFKEAEDKVHILLEASGQKDTLLERASNALNIANEKLQEQVNLSRQLIAEIDLLKQAVSFQEGRYTNLMHQKKSSEVRTGKITEQMSPFLADYPLSPATAKFIGDPIDFVHFDEDKITFVEVKSGKSHLSKRQRQIRDLVKAGKVEFTIYRVEGKD